MIDRLSTDLRRAFAMAYPEPDVWQQAAANMPWGHIMRLLDTVPDRTARAWYAQKAVEHGWSRAILTHQIEAKL